MTSYNVVQIIPNNRLGNPAKLAWKPGTFEPCRQMCLGSARRGTRRPRRTVAIVMGECSSTETRARFHQCRIVQRFSCPTYHMTRRRPIFRPLSPISRLYAPHSWSSSMVQVSPRVLDTSRFPSRKMPRRHSNRLQRTAWLSTAEMYAYSGRRVK